MTSSEDLGGEATTTINNNDCVDKSLPEHAKVTEVDEEENCQEPSVNKTIDQLSKDLSSGLELKESSTLDNNVTSAVLSQGAELKEVEKKKKKKKKKKKMNNSGFEEFMADGPLTLQEVEMEATLYDTRKPFSERIELCIQRYRSKRKWDAQRLRIFSQYLALGGISTGPKQFSGGLDEKKLDDMDTEQISQLAAVDFVMQDDLQQGEGSEWAVDFTYVVRGFLSYKIPYFLVLRTEKDLETACAVIKNFLNYVIHHNVAPEHLENIKEAIEIANLAEKELAQCSQVSNRLPGGFNMACSTIYGGFYEGLHCENHDWDQSEKKIPVGLPSSVAEEMVSVAVSKRGTDKHRENGVNRKVVRRDYMSLEVTEIIMPPSEGPLPKGADKDLPENKYFRSSNALGVLKVKPWVEPDPLDDESPDLPDDQKYELEFWVEKSILQYCFVKMHLQCRVHRLDDGLVFIDNVTGVMVSFFLRLETPPSGNSDDEYD